MKVKYIYRGKPKDFLYPNLIEDTKEVFQTLQNMKWSKYFKKPTVYFYPNAPMPRIPKNIAFMQITLDNPVFHFGIIPINGYIKLQSFVFGALAKEPVANIDHGMRLIVGHEIGHWISLSNLAKLPQYGGSPQLVHIMGMTHYYDRLEASLSAKKLPEHQTQLLYRKLFPERWADKTARIILSKMPEGGRSEHISGSATPKGNFTAKTRQKV